MNNSLENKNILLTGGTGTFGKKFTEISLRDCNLKKLRIYSRNEYSQYKMEQEFQDKRIRFLIGDVRDLTRLKLAMTDIDIVVHAAALKHVPICEYNPIEAVQTNIYGMINVILAAIDSKVEKVMFISSDKAVAPINLYGMTKAVAEKLCIQANVYSKGTKFSAVRYGNVIGSRGSVIELFKDQSITNKLTVTNEDMTRFWISADDGIKFVINSIGKMIGGEVFVPKMPSMKIIDLAKLIAPDAKIDIIGTRIGEKLHETLISKEESIRTTTYDNYFMIKPNFPFWKSAQKNHETDEFTYSSDTNNWWINKEEMLKYL